MNYHELNQIYDLLLRISNGLEKTDIPDIQQVTLYFRTKDLKRLDTLCKTVRKHLEKGIP